MNIIKTLDIDLDNRLLICFVGAGGKTTTMFKLAHELKKEGKCVLATTTTKIFYPKKGQYDNLILTEIDKDYDIECKKNSITVMGRNITTDDKIQGLDIKTINELQKQHIFDYILVEGDGAKRKPIKAPSEHEPVVPPNSNKVVGIIGLDSLGTEINKHNVHREELFSKITNSKLGDIVDKKAIIRLIIHRDGLFKNVKSKSEKYLLLNKMENSHRKNAARDIKKDIENIDFDIKKIIMGSIKTKCMSL